MKLWNDYELNKTIEDFTVGDDYLLDQKLVKYDCKGCIAHTKMLGKIGILTMQETKKMVQELECLIRLNAKGKFKILKKQEDVHTAIENYLQEKIGELGAKIHTGRSRNDQVLTALRLYYKDELQNCRILIEDFIDVVKKFIREYGDIKLPGYTHTRKAMPTTIGIWAGSFVESMADNLRLLDCAFDLIDQSPLGTGAGYGVPIKVDRAYTAKQLGFKRVQNNPIYVQNSRSKFQATILHSFVQIMFDLNKIATDLTMFSMPVFGYFEIPKDFCTGSSIMPQKRNPDVLELMRAKYHEVLAIEFQIKTVTANLISGYNRDIQSTKKALMQAVETTKQCLFIIKLVFEQLKANKQNCENALTPEIYATEEAYKLVKQGIPFRKAYHQISKKYENRK